MTLRLWGAPGFSAKLTHEIILVRSYIEDIPWFLPSYNEENFYFPLDGMLVHYKLPLPHILSKYSWAE